MSRHNISETKTCFTMEAIVECIPDAIVVIDVEKRVQWLNRAAEKITGVSRAEAFGRACSVVLRSTMCREDCALYRDLKAGKSMVDAPAFLSSGGKYFPVSISLAPMKDACGNLVGAVETVRELSGAAQRDWASAEELAGPALTSRSPLMLKVLNQLPAIASSASTVLILGKTGTGKELMARMIHRLSPRRHGPFVAVNCGAFTETLLASELFGHKRGAFTGADKDRAGCFAQAKAGSLFLDDIEVMSLAMQTHLLRVLQEHAYQPLGASRSETTDTRVILASNEDLLEMVRKGTFRQDLYYRVNVARLELPPLRQRKEDIPLLVEQMVESFNRAQGRSIQGIQRDALAMLSAYEWPGNVRELQNAIERAFIGCKEDLIYICHVRSAVKKRHRTAIRIVFMQLRLSGLPLNETPLIVRQPPRNLALPGRHSCAE